MVKVRFFTMARDAAGAEECSIEATDVKELLGKLSEKFGKKLKRILRGSEVFVNGLNVSGLNGYETRLEKKDVVWLIPPAGGG